MKRKLSIIIGIVLMVFSISTTLQSKPQWDGRRYTPQDRAYLEEYGLLNPDQSVRKAWLDICGRNQMLYPDLDKVKPGDTILLPLGYDVFVAQAGGRDCMWRAAEWFNYNVVYPFYGRPVPGSAPTTSPSVTSSIAPKASVTPEYATPSPWPLRLLVGAIVALVALLVWLLFGRSNKFVRRPPNFRQASDAAVMPVAEMALQTALGRNVQIVGPVERGFINGEQVMFYANGSSRRETYVNEPGFRTRVRFPNGQERTVVCRWACFNPCWSASDSSFHGTFMPQGSQVAQQIPAITNEGVDAVIRTISAGEGNVSPELIPADTVSKTVAVPETASVELPDGTMELTELRISTDKGITMIGKFRLTVQQVNDLTYQVTGRRETDGKTKRGKDAKKSNPAS